MLVPTTISMLADTKYKLTFVGNNYTGSWRWDFVTNGGFLKNAENISMNATGEFADTVPEPATMLLFGTGLVGLVGSRLRKKRK